MTTKTWFGGTSYFNDPNDWSPPGVPQGGDTAVISMGTVKLHSHLLSGVSFQIGSAVENNAPPPSEKPVLDLRNVKLNSEIGFPISKGQDFYAGIRVSGVVQSAGDIGLLGGRSSPDHLQVYMSRYSLLVNSGTITLGDRSTFDIKAAKDEAAFINTGTVLTSGGMTLIESPVVGNGRFEVEGDFLYGFTGRLTFAQDVAPGTHVDLSATGSSVLTLDKPCEFLGDITLSAVPSHVPPGVLTPGVKGPNYNEIDLPNTVATSETFANNQLNLFNGEELVAKLNIIGDLTSANFALRPLSSGGTAIEYIPPASATMAAATTSSMDTMMPVLNT